MNTTPPTPPNERAGAFGWLSGEGERGDARPEPRAGQRPVVAPTHPQSRLDPFTVQSAINRGLVVVLCVIAVAMTYEVVGTRASSGRSSAKSTRVAPLPSGSTHVTATTTPPRHAPKRRAATATTTPVPTPATNPPPPAPRVTSPPATSPPATSPPAVFTPPTAATVSAQPASVPVTAPPTQVVAVPATNPPPTLPPDTVAVPLNPTK